MLLCDEFEIQRRAMVLHQLRSPGRDINHPAVLRAMHKIPRHEFVPLQEQARAYAEDPVPLAYGQTLSQPYLDALLTASLDLRHRDRVLEIGTGSGYQAAVLSELASEVYTIEIVPALAARAAKTLERLHDANVHVRCGDGAIGWPEAAPFDAILVACTLRHIPRALTAQLTPTGRMIVPVGTLDRQNVVLLHNTPHGLWRSAVLPVACVPMPGLAHRRGRGRDLSAAEHPSPAR